MIITEINSGMGNQMFQYAAGFSLAAHLNCPLKLNLKWYDHPESMQTARKYDLGIFNLPGQIATNEEISNLAAPSSKGLINRFKHRQNRNSAPHKRWVYEEPFFHYDPNFYQATSPVMLSGYWQSEKYFVPVAEDIRNCFSLKIATGTQNAGWERLIMNSNSVSLHVRRGDMVSDPEVMRVHGACDHEYYREAARRLASAVENPVFFVFSDDPAWCMENLETGHTMHFIDNNQDENSWLDMQLMRMCRHNIIANSSFSWWGAWLNTNPEKKVISPLRWFNHKNHDTKDLIPDSWERI